MLDTWGCQILIAAAGIAYGIFGNIPTASATGVPVIVRDEAGRQVTNLKADDFRIYDLGKLQTIPR